MKNSTTKLESDSLLRKKVEELLKHSLLEENAPFSDEETLKLIHKLCLFETEPEIQSNHHQLRDEKFRTLFEANRDSITIYRLNSNYKPSNFIEANKATTTILGYTKKELKLLNIRNLESVTEKVWKNRIETLLRNEKINFETVITTKNKKIRNVEIESAVINYENQPAVMCILRDITDRKLLEQNTRIAQENLETILDAIPDLLFEVDLEGRIYHYHSHRSDLLAVPPNVFMGRLFEEVIPEEASNTIKASLHDAKEKGWSLGKQYALDLPRGKHWFEISASPINISNHFIVLARDITERKQVEESLLEIEEKNRRLVENSTDAIAILSKEKILFANKECVRLFVATNLKQLIGKSILHFVHPDSIASVNKYIKKITTQSKYVQRREEKLIRLDNSSFNVEIKAIPTIYDHKPAIQIIIHDITEVKRMSNELLKLNRIYALISQINNLIIRTKNREKLFEDICEIAVNYGKFRMCWIGLLDGDNQTIYSRAHNGFEMDHHSKGTKILISDISEGRGPVGTAMREGRTVVCNDIANDPRMKPWRKEVLERGYHSLIGLPIKIRNKTIGILCLYSDEINFFSLQEEIQLLEKITQNISFCLETILIEEERNNDLEKIRLLSQAIEQSPVSIMITNKMGDIEYVNRKYSETTGYTINELIGKNSRMLKSGYTSSEEYEQLWQTIIKGEDWHGEFQNKKKDGQLYWESSTISPIVNKKGKTTHYIALSEDITDRKKKELELIKTKEHAEESDRFKSAFLANMSHEIRTPMNGILGFTELLKSPNLSRKEQQEYIGIIEKSGIRMLSIINDIISISKIESGEVEISLSETNLNEQIEYLYNFFKPEAKQKAIKLILNTELNSKEEIVKLDREKVYAILTNLIKNALKFTDEGTVEFGYTKKDKYIEYFVKDSGIGIAKQEQKFVFERFRQVNESLSRNMSGSGLGLAISKAYVEMLGGKIWVESTLGKGSTFYFTMPYIKEKDIQKTFKDGIKAYKIQTHIKNLKILIVEDDEISKLLMTIAIKKFAKEIIKVSTGLDAIETCRNNPDIDLVMMDVNMPEMDGYEATREIRKFNKDLIIIAQTANGLSIDRDKALAAGCTDYISKPIDIISLTTLIQKYF